MYESLHVAVKMYVNYSFFTFMIGNNEQTTDTAQYTVALTHAKDTFLSDQSCFQSINLIF